MKLNVFTKIILASLIPSILIFSFVIISISHNVYKSSVDSAKSATTLNSDVIKIAVQSTVNSLGEVVINAAKNLGDMDASSENARDYAVKTLFMLQNSKAYIYNSWFVFAPDAFDGKDAAFKSEEAPSGRFMKSFSLRNGKMVELFDMEESDLGDPVDSAWYLDPMKTGKPFFDQAGYYDFEDGKGPQYVSSISAPIIRDGKVIGVVGVDILYEQLFKFLDDMEKAEHIKIMTISQAGYILYASDPKYYYKNVSTLAYSDHRGLKKSITDNTEYINEAITDFFGGRSLVKLMPVDFSFSDEKWSLCIISPLEAIYAQADAFMKSIVSTSGLGIMILCAAAFFVARSIAKPIKQLTYDTDKIANGDILHAFTYEGKSKDEIAALATSIKRMVTQLHVNAESLEHKVQDRTRELSIMTQTAQNAAQAKTQFLASMSHEIRTPMNAIMGMSELLSLEPLTDKQSKYVHDIKTSSTALLKIINDILDLSKIETGKLSLQPVDFNFLELLENIHSLFEFVAQGKNLVFALDVSEEVPHYLFCDDIRLRQVLVNLIGNSIKFTKAGSVGLRVAAKGKWICFEIWDTGIGIKEEDRSRLFQAFEQLDESANRKVEGTGLGLSITKKIIELMKGTIRVESIYGQGTTFFIEIPLILGDKRNIEDTTGIFKFINAPTANVLLVDDNEINIHVGSGLLSLCGITCDAATSGFRALEMVQTKNYDLVFMDHMMPEMDGLETTKKIRDLGEPFKTLPIVALSANAIAGAKEMFLEAGLDGFLSKPIDKVKLVHILKKWIPSEKITERESAENTAIAKKEITLPTLQQAREIPDLDLDMALERLNNMENVYELSLKLLSRKIPESCANMSTYLSNKELDKFAIDVHGMKGSLASIGQMKLSGLAKELETESKAKNLEFCEANFATFHNQLQEFGYALTKIFEAADTVALQQGDDMVLADTMRNVSAALDVFDRTAALTALTALEGFTYGDKNDSMLKELKEATEAFDFDRGIDLSNMIYEVKDLHEI